MAERTYIAIDLKSFYASSECAELGFDPLSTHLVVADQSRTDKTICLAVSPSLKAYGLPGRARLFEVKAKLKEVNAARRAAAPGGVLRGESYDAKALAANPNLAAGVYIAKPRMSHYLNASGKIYGIYLRYASADDIHVYSIDEVFMDVTRYLHAYGKTPHELARDIVRAIYSETGITATAGIGTNLYLAKVAMDIVAKHMPADAEGVRIAQLDETSYRRLLWGHRPLTDFWRVGRGYAKKLESYGLMTMGDIARCSLGRASDYYNEDLLYRLFGVNAELLIDHAWGWEPCTISDIKAYKPAEHSVGAGQVLTSVALFDAARLIAKEMAESLALDLVGKGLKTNRVALAVGYDTASLDPGRLDVCAPDEVKRAAQAAAAAYTGPIGTDYYGRRVPKAVSGSIDLGGFTSSSAKIRAAIDGLFCRLVDSRLLVRRLNVTALDVATSAELEAGKRYEQPDLFSAADGSENGGARSGLQERKSPGAVDEHSEHAVQQTLLDIKRKFGKNSVIKAMDMFDGATGRQRNNQIGGHAA
ncbi:type VI secretion protein ImpB [Bifidobacterium pseudocatenulatum]|uniref:Y-family DNA polymerase n=1 Tax=Bifidobacterium pseudocatenulatum TaxID=28026 RepID=UPI000E41E330|nr:type VI secretion protein ImpB [Bifidobacterium pseudocatenulatum]GDZ09727.1 DNA methylase [Bifidobacteriaceae bacterium MCC01994]GDZ11515.1 DNA methylase [Bifidobacteriaceae bacterium MCC01993]MCB4904991.1 type VI secretion protein ImpB [Bifidobacterium pseudocatenulatum]MCC2157690.1 type VI secretion protein ImpB [Bifidobacterium pseudocatenulatum]RGJ18794.1 type VI secretion protein ImpB [Bifidobacterium pseudocatenulatum]